MPSSMPMSLVFRLAAAMLALAAVGACAERQTGSVTPQEAPVATGRPAEAGPSVHWRASLAGDMALIEIQDRNNAYRVDKVELVAPDGRSYASNDITRERLTPGGRWSDSGSGVGVGVGGSGGSSGRANLGVLFDIPLGGGRAADPVDSEARTTARIPLPDPAAYRATAAQWKVRISFSDLAGYYSTAVIPAPLPQ